MPFFKDNPASSSEKSDSSNGDDTDKLIEMSCLDTLHKLSRANTSHQGSRMSLNGGDIEREFQALFDPSNDIAPLYVVKQIKLGEEIYSNQQSNLTKKLRLPKASETFFKTGKFSSKYSSSEGGAPYCSSSTKPSNYKDGRPSNLTNRSKKFNLKELNITERELTFQREKSVNNDESNQILISMKTDDGDDHEVIRNSSLCLVKFKSMCAFLLSVFVLLMLIILLVPLWVTHDSLTFQLHETQRNSNTEQKHLTKGISVNMTNSLSRLNSYLLNENIGSVFFQPQHAANSIINALLYLHDYVSDESSVSQYLGKYNGPKPYLNNVSNEYEFDINLPLFNKSITKTIFNVISTDFYNQTVKGFAVYEDQIITINLVRNPTTFSTEESHSVFTFKDIPYVFIFNSTSNSTFQLNPKDYVKLPVKNVSYSNNFNDADVYDAWNMQKDLAIIYNKTKNQELTGKWSNSTIIWKPSDIKLQFGWFWSFPWAPCGDYSCLEAAVGGVLTFVDLSLLCNKNIKELLLLLNPITELLNSKILMIEENYFMDGFSRLLLNTSKSKDTILTEFPVDSYDLIEKLVEYHISFVISQKNGELWATSDMSKIKSFSISPSDFNRETKPIKAYESEDIRIQQILKYIMKEYGDISENNGNYSKPIDIYIDISNNEMKKCEDDLASMSSCLYVNVNWQDTPKERTLFPTINGLSFLSISAVPSFFVLGNINTIADVSGAKSQQQMAVVAEDLHRVFTIETIIGVIFGFLGFIVALCIMNYIATPLVNLRKTIDSLQELNFTHLKSIKSFSNILEIKVIQEAIIDITKTLKVLTRFIPETVIHQILHDEDSANSIRVESKNVTVFFSDLAGFTTISELFTPKELLHFLTRYLTVMSKSVEAHEGTVCEIQGDGILAFWNTPDRVEMHAMKACACALDQQEVIKVLNYEFKYLLDKYNINSFEMRIGVHTGDVLTGNLGSMYKLKFGCLGDTVNQGSRLEGICKLYGVSVICSEDTVKSMTPGSFYLRNLDLVKLKGKHTPTNLYEVIALRRYFEFVKTAKIHRNTLDKKKKFDVKSLEKDKKEIDVVVKYIYQPDKALIEEELLDISLYHEALKLYQRESFEEALNRINSVSHVDPAVEFLKLRIIEAKTLFFNEDSTFINQFNNGILRLHDKSF